MSRELYKEISATVKARKSWADKFKLWYDMRHHGLRRKALPFPGAADLHYPLADTLIEKQKPFYFAQLFGSETLAQFVDLRERPAEADPGVGEPKANSAEEIAEWFDDKLKNDSNLEEELLATIDSQLQNGRPVLKVFWNAHSGNLQFEQVDGIYFIVPRGTTALQDAEWVCHVRHFTKAEYKRRKNFNQAEDLLKRICGRGDSENSEGTQLEDRKDLREGIHYSADADGIIVWEVYRRTEAEDGCQVEVETFSPRCPDEPVRAKFKLADNHERRAGKDVTLYPFVDFPNEIKDKGWESPRGLTEIVAAFETSLNKNWNEKHDAMTFYNRPIFRNAGNKPINMGNKKLVPGQVLDADIQRVEMGTAPISFDQEMNNTRLIAEQRVGTPDFGTGQQLNQNERKTATEVTAIAQQMSVATDLRVRIFRGRMRQVYRLAWGALVSNAQDQLVFLNAKRKFGRVDKSVLHLEYRIEPSGSIDSWNKGFQQQRAGILYNTFRNDPYIDQGELRKYFLEAHDPRLIDRLYVEPDLRAANEAEDEAFELLLMIEGGYPAQVKEDEDHARRIDIIVQKLEQMAALGKPFDPGAKALVMQHLEQHMALLRKQNPGAYRQKKERLKQAEAQAERQSGNGALPRARPGTVAELIRGGGRRIA